MNEFDLIREVFQHQASLNTHLTDASILCGIGDDAAVLNPPAQQQLVTCVDTLVAGRHFPLGTSAYAIGYKAVAVNLSDLAAMGATPHSILLALSLPQPNKDDSQWLQDFAKGLFSCCNQFGVRLIGGDTTKSDTLTITVTAMGYAKHCIYRSSAQVGDAICVTGNIGSAAYALQQLLQKKPAHELQAELDTPKPRVAIGQWLAEQQIANSMIDISDGLLQDLGHVCEQSNVGATLNLNRLPTHAQLYKIDLEKRLQLQLSGGDDYELLFTCSQDKLSNITSANFDTPITMIGTIVNNSKNRVQLVYENQHYPYNNKGYQHF